MFMECIPGQGDTESFLVASVSGYEVLSYRDPVVATKDRAAEHRRVDDGDDGACGPFLSSSSKPGPLESPTCGFLT